MRRGRGSSRLFFVNHEGKQPSKLPSSVQALAKEYGVSIPNLNTHRKVATTKASTLRPEEQEQVAAFMKHSIATQQRYYKMQEAKKDSIKAFEMLNNEVLSPPDPVERTPTSKRHKYGEDDEKMIRDYFDIDISSGRLPLISECRSFLERHPIANRTAQHIRDKVKTFIRQTIAKK